MVVNWPIGGSKRPMVVVRGYTSIQLLFVQHIVWVFPVSVCLDYYMHECYLLYVVGCEYDIISQCKFRNSQLQTFWRRLFLRAIL